MQWKVGIPAFVLATCRGVCPEPPGLIHNTHFVAYNCTMKYHFITKLKVTIFINLLYK